MQVVSLLLLSFVGVITNVQGTVFPKATYCAISSHHTMCLYDQGKLGPACHEAVPYTITAADQTHALKAINDLRSQVALGHNPAGKNSSDHFKLPSAANMNALVWDDELAAIAERWSYQCIWNHEANLGGSTAVAHGRLSTGQNMFLGGASSSHDWTPDWPSIMNLWFQEYNFVTGKYFHEGSDPHVNWMTVGHVREVIYGSTTSIGCGLMRYMSGTSLKNQVVCNFGSPQNNPGNAYYYVAGDPGTQCPHQTKEDPHTGLCVAH